MRTLLILGSLVAAITAQSDVNAPIIQDNPVASFRAALQDSKPVQGYIFGDTNSNGTGVVFNVNFYDFPDASAGPFAYHIHVNPIPDDGNCTAAGGHLDPYRRGDSPACNLTENYGSNCQVGDLSGKHGSINNTASEADFQPTYVDLYVSTDPNSPAYFGNRSIVIHAKNGTRLNCGNFIVQPTRGRGNGNASNTASASSAADGTASMTGSAAATGTAGGTSGAGGFIIGAENKIWSITMFLGIITLGTTLVML